jgi:HEAT repeat protein
VSELGIFTTDKELIVRSWDRWIESASGIAADRAVGRTVTDLIPDMDRRGLLGRFQDAATAGTVHVLAPSFHHFLIRCAPRTPSPHFTEMQQRVTIGPLRDRTAITGVIVAIEDVTPRLDEERVLAEALKSQDPAVRREAAEAIAAASRIENPDTLSSALQDDDWRVRRSAVQGFARSGDSSFVRSIIESVRHNHRHFGLLSSALKLLALTEHNVTDPLIALLDDPEPDVRIQAALALGEQHDQKATDALVNALDDDHTNVRFQAIESLGRLRAEAAIDKLAAIVESRDFFLAFPALDALAAIGDRRVAPELTPLLADNDLRAAVADALGVLGDDRAVRPLVAALNVSAAAAVSIVNAIVAIHDRFDRHYHDGGRVVDLVRGGLDQRGRAHAVSALDTATPEQVHAMVRLLGWLQEDEIVATLARLLAHPHARAEAVEALVRQGPPAVDAVLAQLNADDDETRRAAVIVAGRLGDRRATAPLVALLDDDPHSLVPVAGALARIGDPAATESLLGLLGHAEASVRQAAIGALNSIGHPELHRRIDTLLGSRDALVRESAVRIAGYFGYAGAADRLLALADDDDEAVRTAAVEHLVFIDDDRGLSRLVAALEADTARTRAAAARALARADSHHARQALMTALYDTDPWVRYYAVRAVAERRHGGAIDPLMRLAQSDPAPQVRVAAIDALGSLAARAATDVVKQLASDSDDDVSAAALAALGHLISSEVPAELQDGLRAGAPVRRLAAIRGLAASGAGPAIRALEWAALADEQDDVVSEAISAIERVARRETASDHAVDALCRLLGDPARRERAAAALARLPATYLGNVARGLQDPSADVRAAVVDVLGRAQKAEATALVVTALTDPDAAVRETAVATLMRLGVRGLESQYATLAADDPSKRVRRAAAAALAEARMLPT